MGWNGSGEKNATPVQKKTVKTPPSKWRGLVALLVVVVGGFAAWIALRPAAQEEAEESVPVKPTKIAETKPAVVTNKVLTPVVDERKEREDALCKRREMIKKMTPDEKLAFLYEEAKRRPIPEASTNRIFRTGVEQVMGWVFTCELGNPPPLLPKLSLFDEAHLAEILIMDNPISETDSDRAKFNKEAVQAAKKEFIDYIKQGGDPYEFLPYYHGQLVQAHEEFKMARRSMMETLKNDPDIAPEFIKKVNDSLAAKGIKKVEIPQQVYDKFGVQPAE